MKRRAKGHDRVLPRERAARSGRDRGTTFRGRAFEHGCRLIESDEDPDEGHGGRELRLTTTPPTRIPPTHTVNTR